MEAMNEKVRDHIDEMLTEFAKEMKLSHEEVESKLSIKVFPVGEKMYFILLEFDGSVLASVMDFGDHLIASYYHEKSNGESKDNLH